MKKIYLSSFAIFAAFALNAQTKIATISTLTGKVGVEGFAPLPVHIDSAKYFGLQGIAVDAQGRLWVSEGGGASRIRVIDPGVSQVYNKTGYFLDPNQAGGTAYINGTGNVSRYDSPFGITIGSDGYIYIADEFNNAIRKKNGVGTNVGTAQAVSTFAGPTPPNNDPGYSEGSGSAARFYNPRDLAIDASGNVYVVDYYNFAIRKITPSGLVSTLAGDGNDGDNDGIGIAAQFGLISAIAVYDANHVVICDQSNNKIKLIHTSTGAVSTIAGINISGHLDGHKSVARLSDPTGIAVDKDLNIYFSEGGTSGQSNIIRRITGDTITTIAGKYQATPVFRNGIDTAARFNKPGHLAFNVEGDVLYVVDAGNNVIRALTFSIRNDSATNAVSPVKSELGLKAYPNPSQGQVSVSFISSNNAKTMLSLFDASGKLIETREFYQGENTSVYSELTRGIYILRAVNSEGKSQTIKISVN